MIELMTWSETVEKMYTQVGDGLYIVKYAKKKGWYQFHILPVKNPVDNHPNTPYQQTDSASNWRIGKHPESEDF